MSSVWAKENKLRDLGLYIRWLTLRWKPTIWCDERSKPGLTSRTSYVRQWGYVLPGLGKYYVGLSADN